MKILNTIFETAFVSCLVLFASCQPDEVTINKGPIFLNEVTVTGTDAVSGEQTVSELAPGTKKVPLDGVITVKFSKDIDPSTSSNITFKKSGVDVPAAISIEGSTVTIDPASVLDPGGKYNLFLGSGLRSSDGGMFNDQTSIAFSAVGGLFDDLVAQWSFEDTLVDSVSESSGTATSTGFAAGVKGKGLSLDVANKSYYTFNAGPVITGVESFTLSLWVNPAFVDSDSNNGIDGILGLVNLSNKSRFWGNIDWFVENGSNPTTAKVVAHITNGTNETWMNIDIPGLFNTWSHFALTYDAGTSTFTYYLNGEAKTTAIAGWTGPLQFTDSGPMVFGTVHFQTTPSLTTGTGSQDWASYLTGTIDEVRFFSVALSGGEILNLYNSEKP